MKKNIILGIVFLVAAIILIIVKNQGTYIKGRVIDITYYENKENKSTILINIDNEPLVVYFDIDINKIELNDILKIKTTGIVRESYPAQMDGLSYKKLRNNSTKIKGEYDPSDIDTIKTIVFNSSFYDEESNYKSRFKTKIYNDLSEFKEFVSSRGIIIPDNMNLNTLYKDYIAVVSYTNMSSSGNVDFYGLYKEDNTMYIYTKINSKEIVITDIVTRGVISFVSKEYSYNEFETLSKYILEKE